MAAVQSRTVCGVCGKDLGTRAQMFKHLKTTICGESVPDIGGKPLRKGKGLERVALRIGYQGKPFEVQCMWKGGKS
jgi:hypothetical protein